MGTTLHTLAPNKGATKTKKRLGRGRGSGTGKTSGKGVKGQKARPGHHGARIGFEGGQMPMKMRIAKRGFKNPFRIEAFPINLKTLESIFEAGATIDLEALRAKGLVPKSVECLKILGEGDLTKKLTVRAHRFSASAREKIEGVGGTAVVLGGDQPAPAPAA
jgi:large subunit ribosomal protein L15